MKRMAILGVVSVLVMAWPAVAWAEDDIITPAGAGAAGGSLYYPLEYAFDGQPTWDSQNEEPTGGGSGSSAPSYPNRHGYVDFGEDWPDVRITETWTMYREWSVGDQVGYAEMWWDDDNDNVNDNGVTEGVLAFNTAQDIDTAGNTPWIQDVDSSSTPIAAQRRYLILASSATMTSRAKEYAFVGYLVPNSNNAPIVDAGEDASVALPHTVVLHGDVMDDGRPEPASVSVTWSRQSGPDTMFFGDANVVDTTAIFTEAGTYVLRLTADDGDLTSYDEVTITVTAAETMPSMKDFIGINVHVGSIVSNFPDGCAEFYRPTTAMIRDYHSIGWDILTTDAQTNFPKDRWNWINWTDEYQEFVDVGYQVDACIQFLAFGDGDWVDPEADAYAYGYDFATCFGPTYGSGVVTSVQIGNEPTNMSESLYMTVFENMAEGVRDADPALTIVTCNAKDLPSGAYHKDITLFEDLTDLLDVVAIHTYPMVTGWPDYERSYPEDPQIPDYLGNVQADIDWCNANAPGKEVWITEFGYDSSLESWSGNVTYDQQAQWLIRSFLIFSEMDLERAYMYYYNDGGSPGFHACSGLTVHFEPKPAFWAQSHLLTTLGDYRFSGVIQKNSSLYVYAYEHENDSDDIIWAIWLPTGSDQETEITLTDLPGTPLWADRMPLESGLAPNVSFEVLSSDSIELLVTESPTYLNMAVGDPPVNQAPVVDAGGDDTITLPFQASLDATVSDDDRLPHPPAWVTVQWTKESGPGWVVFDDDEAVDTSVAFSTDGEYVLRLTADDGALQSYDEVTITVNAASEELADVIVDNADATGVTITGYWVASTSTAGYYGSNYLGDNNAGKGTKSVCFTPTIPSAGTYEVYARWTALSNRASNVPIDITDTTGTDTVTVNQQSDGGTWMLLGTYDFAVGWDGNVTIRTDDTNGYVIADAVRFLQTSQSAMNEAPLVDAGEDIDTTFAQNVVILDGAVTDDDLPDPPAAVTIQWTKQSGPGTVTFDDDAILDAEATFSVPGSYVLRLTADDGYWQAYDEVTVLVMDDIIMDNADATGVTITGWWGSSSSVAGYYGSNYIHDNNVAKGSKSVQFTPTIASAGAYEVYARWTSFSNRATNVPIDITDAIGTDTVTVDQQADGGTWVLLGTYDFDEGTDGNVLIRTTGTNGYVIADAVRFIQVE